jgi:hypothetical protein
VRAFARSALIVRGTKEVMMARVVEENEMTKVANGQRMMSTGRLWGAGAAVAILVSSMHAFAADAAFTPMFDSLATPLGPIAGDVHCDQFAPRSEILELEINNPGAGFSLTDDEGQEIEGIVREKRELQFTATMQIYATIVRGERSNDDNLFGSSTDDDDGDDFGAVSNAYVFG